MSEDKQKKEDIEQDVVFEDEEETANPQAVIKKLREKLKSCEKKGQEYFDSLQRTKADFINLRKKDEAEKQAFVKVAHEEVIASLIPILDSFEHAFADGKALPSVPQEWRAGFESIQNQLESLTSRYGVEKIYPLGEDFSPLSHEAMELVEVESEEDDGKVVAVLQTGYRLNGKVIRSAKVKVGAHHPNH
ncbi:nucleotide exchange factor GrpE [Patescibacteria group bacterium]|nr:MAG: nucleotide exchange factor GrpE [Patescibacteria group bacterium]